MTSLQVAAGAGGLSALTLLVYAVVQFSDPSSAAEDLLRGFLGLGLGLLAVATMATAVGLRAIVE